MSLLTGECFTTYDGELLYEHELPKHGSGEYRIHIDKNIYLEGINRPTPGLGFGSLVNRCNSDGQKNCEFVVDEILADKVISALRTNADESHTGMSPSDLEKAKGSICVLQTIKPVAKNSELLTTYGSRYPLLTNMKKKESKTNQP
ncbi:hypothetical protein AC1031_008356 [Aphanomyces cochlioides]|nr:hypothetical protein AC1031_008356 [Aphanomyces cochlioides]